MTKYKTRLFLAIGVSAFLVWILPDALLVPIFAFVIQDSKQASKLLEKIEKEYINPTEEQPQKSWFQMIINKFKS